MSSEQLKKYFKTILQLECECRTMQETMATIKAKSQRLGIKTKFIFPQKGKLNRSFEDSEIAWGFVIAVGSIIVGHIIGSILGVFSDTLEIVVIVIGYLLGAFFTWGTFQSIKEVKEKESQLEVEYEKAKEDYVKAIVKDDSRIEKELTLKTQLEDNLQRITQQYEEKKRILEEYYDLNIIYPTYRNIVPVATFLQYIDSCRCTSLEGHEGAINLYENERRLNLIVTKLDTVIEKLDEIQTTQFALVHILRESNAQISKMCAGINTVNAQINTLQQMQAIEQYNTEQTAENVKLLKDYEMWRDMLSA